MSPATEAAPIPESASTRIARVFWHPVHAVLTLLHMNSEVWEGDNLIISRSRGYSFHAFRYVGPRGETRWQTVSISEHSPMHAYWIVGDKVYLTRGKLSKKRYRGNFMGPVATDVDAEERAALLEGIQQMTDRAR